MTKAQAKKELQTQIDAWFNQSRERVESMMDQAHNPQVAAMIEKNRGYMMALQDVTDLLYNRKIF
jgi:hypothetical protein